MDRPDQVINWVSGDLFPAFLEEEEFIAYLNYENLWYWEVTAQSVPSSLSNENCP